MIKDNGAWADFFITRIGLMLFAAMLLLSAFRVYPMFQEREAKAGLDSSASDIAAKIEAVDSTSIAGYRYVYLFDEKYKYINIEISTEYVVSHMSFNSGRWDERKLVHAEPLVTHAYPPNSNWSNTSGFRKYLSEATGNNGDARDPINSSQKGLVENIFNNTINELAGSPFMPDTGKPLVIEKFLIYYKNPQEARDYVLIYQE